MNRFLWTLDRPMTEAEMLTELLGISDTKSQHLPLPFGTQITNSPGWESTILVIHPPAAPTVTFVMDLPWQIHKMRVRKMIMSIGHQVAPKIYAYLGELP